MSDFPRHASGDALSPEDPVAQQSDPVTSDVDSVTPQPDPAGDVTSPGSVDTVGARVGAEPASTEPDIIDDTVWANTFSWKRRLIFPTALLVAMIVIWFINPIYGWWQIVLGVILISGIYLGFAWLGSLHRVENVDGQLIVHSARKQVTIDGPDVAAVHYVMNRRSPDIQLITHDRRKVLIRTSHLEKGHSRLFRWLGEYAPEAELDRGSVRVKDLLESRGMLP